MLPLYWLVGLTTAGGALALVGMPALKAVMDAVWWVISIIAFAILLVSLMVIIDIKQTIQCYGGNQEECQAPMILLPDWRPTPKPVVQVPHPVTQPVSHPIRQASPPTIYRTDTDNVSPSGVPYHPTGAELRNNWNRRLQADRQESIRKLREALQ